MRVKWILGAVILAFMLIPSYLHSTTVVFMDDETLTKKAKEIFTGQCIGKKSYWTSDKRRIFTIYKFLVTKKIKGQTVTQVVTFKQWGGNVGNYRFHIAGLANFDSNEQAFTFLTPKNKLGFQFTVGLAQGKLRIRRNKQGKRFLIRNTLGLKFKGKNKSGKVQIIRDYNNFEKRICDFVKKHRNK